MVEMAWPWQYSFPPFFTIQPHAETRAKQMSAWRNLVLEYHRINKLGVLDVREAQRCPLFCNAAIDQFYEIAQFPNVIGAIDCSHVQLKAPTVDEPNYVNRHGRHSINVQAIYSAKLIIMSLVQWPGSTYDRFIWRHSTIKRHLHAGVIPSGWLVEDLEKTKNAEPLDKSRHRWHVYYHTLEEWASMIYSWIQDNGMTNTVCTLYELIEGDNTTDEEFHGLESDILIKALRILEASNRAEIIMFDDNQGVKFF